MCTSDRSGRVLYTPIALCMTIECYTVGNVLSAIYKKNFTHELNRSILVVRAKISNVSLIKK